MGLGKDHGDYQQASKVNQLSLYPNPGKLHLLLPQWWGWEVKLQLSMWETENRKALSEHGLVTPSSRQYGDWIYGKQRWGRRTVGVTCLLFHKTARLATFNLGLWLLSEVTLIPSENTTVSQGLFQLALGCPTTLNRGSSMKLFHFIDGGLESGGIKLPRMHTYLYPAAHCPLPKPKSLDHSLALDEVLSVSPNAGLHTAVSVKALSAYSPCAWILDTILL